MQRNRNCPSFDADSDDVSIVETLDVGSVIAQVRAQDSDDEVRIQNRKKNILAEVLFSVRYVILLQGTPQENKDIGQDQNRQEKRLYGLGSS